jgi:hypothetical protein
VVTGPLLIPALGAKHSKPRTLCVVLSPFALPNSRRSVTRSFILSVLVLLRHQPASLSTHLPVTSNATFASADRCARRRICGGFSIVVRHRFSSSFMLVLDLLRFLTIPFLLSFGLDSLVFALVTSACAWVASRSPSYSRVLFLSFPPSSFTIDSTWS